MRQNRNSGGQNLDLGSQENLGPSLGLIFPTWPSMVSEVLLHVGLHYMELAPNVSPASH